MYIRIIFFLTTVSLLTACPFGDNENDPVTPSDVSSSAPSTFDPEEVFMKTVKGYKMKELTKPITYTDSKGIEWKAPEKTYTDGATVPRAFLSITNGRFDNRILGAAVVHDAWCQKENEHRTPEQYKKRSWEDTHRMFYEALLAGGTPESLALGMFGVVWIAGPRWNDPDNDLGEVSEEMLSVGMESSTKLVLDNRLRSPEQLESWFKERQPIILKMSRLEKNGLSALDNRDFAIADKAQQDANALLQESFNKMPNDLVLLNIKGTINKNFGEKYKKLKMDDMSRLKLDASEKAFNQVLKIDKYNPNAREGIDRIRTLKTDAENVQPNNDNILENRGNLIHRAPTQ